MPSSNSTPKKAVIEHLSALSIEACAEDKALAKSWKSGNLERLVADRVNVAIQRGELLLTDSGIDHASLCDWVPRKFPFRSPWRVRVTASHSVTYTLMEDLARSPETVRAQFNRMQEALAERNTRVAALESENQQLHQQVIDLHGQIEQLRQKLEEQDAFRQRRKDASRRVSTMPAKPGKKRGRPKKNL